MNTPSIQTEQIIIFKSMFITFHSLTQYII